jgi:hypothetical protein
MFIYREEIDAKKRKGDRKPYFSYLISMKIQM